MKGIFGEIDGLLGGDMDMEPTPREQKPSRVLEESKSSELVDAIKGLARVWLTSHMKSTSEQVEDALRVASVQEFYDSANPPQNDGPVSAQSSTQIRRCEYKLTSTIEVEGERVPFTFFVNPQVGGY